MRSLTRSSEITLVWTRLVYAY